MNDKLVIPPAEASDSKAGRCAVATGSPFFIIDQIIAGFKASFERAKNGKLHGMESMRGYWTGKQDTLEFAIAQTEVIRREVERHLLENIRSQP